MPKKIVIISPDSRAVFETVFAPTPEGILFPKMRIQQNYFHDPSTGMWNLKLTRTVTVDDCFSVNITIPDSQFDIVFPAGVKVADFRHDR